MSSSVTVFEGRSMHSFVLYLLYLCKLVLRRQLYPIQLESGSGVPAPDGVQVRARVHEHAAVALRLSLRRVHLGCQLHHPVRQA